MLVNIDTTALLMRASKLCAFRKLPHPLLP